MGSPGWARRSSTIALAVVLVLAGSCRFGTHRLPRRLPTSVPVGQGSTGIGSPGPSGPGTVVESSIVVDGRTRTYRLYRPSTLDPATPAPLVIFLHWGLGSGAGGAQQTGFDAEAELGRFLVAYPDGVDRTWNAGGTCCGGAATAGVDDVKFVGALLDHLEATERVDPRRVYATGISNGAILAARLACELSDRFAAVAPVSGTLLVDCNPSRPVSVLFIHGTADQNIPYNGGQGPRALQRPKIDYPAVRSVVERFASLDGCQSSPQTTSAGAVTTDQWPSCRDGTVVELITIAGGGHSWPGGQRMSVFADPPSQALNATSTIWAFFEAHPQQGA